MANTKSALKALRQSKTRATQNAQKKARIKALAKSLRTDKLTPDILNERYSELESALDKAVKAHVIHKNKAARIKSRVYEAAHGTKQQISGKSGSGAKKS